MKGQSFGKHSIVLFIFLFFSTALTALNLEKIRLSELYIENDTHQTVLVDVFFQKKCAVCPRLHETTKQSYILLEGKKKLISEPSTVIVRITSNLASSVTSIVPGKIPTFAVKERRSQELLSIAPDFSAIFQDEEFKLLEQGHKAYIQSMPEGVSVKAFFNKLKKLYNTNNFIKVQAVKRKLGPKIPHIIHLIWFGRKNILPDIFEKWLQEWKEKHAGWSVMVWDEDLVKEKFAQSLFNQKIYDEASVMLDYATMSKLVRYEILHEFGGLVIEPNLKCYESFESLHARYDFYAGLGTLKSYGAVSNSVIGARKGHPILKACMEYIKNADQPHSHDKFGIGHWMMRHLGNPPLTNAVYHKAGMQGNIDIIFPRSFFDGNNVRRRFFHYDPTVHEQSYETLVHQPEAFCSKGAYSTLADSAHEGDPECFQPSFLEDTCALEYLATDVPVKEKPMVLITASYNNLMWYKRNLSSAFIQNYTNYRIIYIDDASPDGTGNLVEQFVKEHQLEHKITLIKNPVNRGAAANFYTASLLCKDDEIMVHLDGDDWLPHENVLAVVNKVYQDPSVWMTFGQCIYHPRLKPGRSRPFPEEVVAKTAFRKYPGWISHHLRTNYAWLFKSIERKDLEYNGDFLKMNWDHALMYPMLEMAGDRAKFVPYMLYVHNGANPLNEGKGEGKKELQKYFAHYIRHQPAYKRLDQRLELSQ